MSPTLDGVLVVDKPEGITSHDVVAVVRRRLARGTKVGHTGTLDPFATGVLPMVIGKATRLAQFLTASRKSYVADVAFGTATDTCDRTGDIVEAAGDAACEALDASAIATALATFLGTHPQVPPAHSAKKVDGERAYVLARRGEGVDLPAVEVTAHGLELQAWDASRRVAVIRLDTSAGFYVRSLARDLGRRLGVPAHLSALRRTASGAFTIADAHGLRELAEADAEQLQAWCLPLERLLTEWPGFTLDDRQLSAVLHGQPVAAPQTAAGPSAGPGAAARDGRVRLLDAAGRLVAVARSAPSAPHLWHADIVLR